CRHATLQERERGQRGRPLVLLPQPVAVCGLARSEVGDALRDRLFDRRVVGVNGAGGRGENEKNHCTAAQQTSAAHGTPPEAVKGATRSNPSITAGGTVGQSVRPGVRTPRG